MDINHTEDIVTDLGTTYFHTEADDVMNPDPWPWDSSDPVFSAYAKDLIKTVFMCYVRQPIIFLGIFGNVVCCLVFHKQGLSDRINLLLFWLAVADLIHLMANFLAVCSCYFSDNVLNMNWNTIYKAKMNHALSWFSVSSGALMTVMSVDRCLSVAMPIKARRLLTYRPMAIAGGMSFLIPFVFYFILFLGHTVEWTVDPSTNRSMAYETETPWFPKEIRLRSIEGFRLVTSCIFLVVITVCSIITIDCLRKATLNRSQLTGITKEKSDDTGDNKTTKMLLFLCVLYASILALRMICSASHLLFPEFDLYRKYHNSVIVVYQALVFPALCVNSAVNFYTYMALSPRFRRHFKELLQCSQRKDVNSTK